jgi:tetratricopeptide (TPR) repeat protein
MAARINTRFILILFISVSIGVGAIGVIAYLTYTRNTDRFIRNGEAAMQAGDYAQAYVWYGKAVSKKPSNVEFLDKAEQALRRIVPNTSNEAQEKYEKELLAILSRRSVVRASDPATHMPFLDELWNKARILQRTQDWLELSRAGEAMHDRVDASNALRNVGLLYKGIGQLQRSEIPDTEQDQAETDVATAVAGLPAGHPLRDVGAGSLAISQSLRASRMTIAGQERPGQEKREQAKKTLSQGLADAPEGVTVAKAALLDLVSGQSPPRNGFGSIPEVAAAIDRVTSLAEKSPDGIAIAEVASTVANIDRAYGGPKARQLLETYTAAHPGSIYHQALLAQIHLDLGEHDAAKAVSQKVIETSSLPVSLESYAQEELKIQSAVMMVRVEFHRWDVSPPAERATHLAAMEKAYEALKKLVPDPESNPSTLEAAGKVHLARGEYPAAAAAFEKIIRAAPKVEAEIAFLAAVCAERMGELGHALDRIDQAIEKQPHNGTLLAYKSEYLRRLGRDEEARGLAQSLLAADSGNVVAAEVIRLLDHAPVPEGADPVGSAIAEAFKMMEQPKEAEAMLRAELERFPEDVRLYRALASVLVPAQETAQAEQIIARGLEKFPNDALLSMMKASLATQDPLERLDIVLNQTIASPAERLATKYVQLRGIAARSRATAEEAGRSGDEATRAKMLALIERADAAAKETLAKATAESAEHPFLIEQLFAEAVMSENWVEAERLAKVAETSNVDQTNGLLYRARIELARKNYAGAIVALNQAKTVNTFSSVVYRLLGVAYQQVGNNDEALTAFAQAYQRRPTDLINVALYVELLVQTGQKLRALEVLRQAVRIAPGNTALVDRQLILESEVGNPQLALQERQKRYKESPQDRTNALRLASLLAMQWPTSQHVVDASGNPRFSQVAWSRLSDVEQRRHLMEAKGAWLQQSEQILRDLAAANPRDLEIVTTRATLLTERGQSEGAARLLQQFIDAIPEAERTWNEHVALGAQLLRNGKGADAEAAFADAIKRQTPTAREADMAIASIYLSRLQFEPALKHLDAVIEVAPDRAILLQAAESHARLRQFDRAKQRLDQAMSSGPAGSAPAPDAVVELLAATIAEGRGVDLLGKGDKEAAKAAFFEQRQAIERAKKIAPSNPAPWIADGNRLLEEFRRGGDASLLDDAVRAADEAAQRRADLPQAVALKVNALRSRGDIAAAVSELDRFVKANPTHENARRDLITLLVQMRNVTRAVEVARDGIASDPLDPKWHVALGQLHGYTGNINDAIESFKRAHELRPNAGSLASLVDVLLAARPPRLDEAKTQLEKRMEDVQSAPYLQSAYGAVLAGLGQKAEGIAQIRQAFAGVRKPLEEGNRGALVQAWFKFALMVLGSPVEVEKLLKEVSAGKPDAQELLAMALIWRSSQDGMSRASEMLQQARQAAPTADAALNAAILFEIGNTHVVQGNAQAAADAYEECLKHNPNHAEALNNLAYLCATKLNDPKRGLAPAQKAVELNPTSPDLRDTLGVLYMMLDRLPESEEQFRKAMSLGAGPEVHLHFAQLKIKMKEPAVARDYLLQGLQKNPSAELRTQMEALLKTLSP